MWYGGTEPGIGGGRGRAGRGRRPWWAGREIGYERAGREIGYERAGRGLGHGWACRGAAGVGSHLRSGEPPPERPIQQQLYQEPPSPAGADTLPSMPIPVVQEGEASHMSIPTIHNPNLMKRWQAGEDAQTYDHSAAGALMMGRAAYRGCGWAGRSAAGAGWPLRSGETQPERQVLQQLYQEPSPAGADKLASLPTPVVQEGEASQMTIPTFRNPNLMKRWQAGEDAQTYDDSAAGALMMGRAAYRGCGWAGRRAAGAGWPLRSGETQPERQVLQQLYQEPSPAGADKLPRLPTPVVQEGEASQMSIPTSRNPNLMKRWQAGEDAQTYDDSAAGALMMGRAAYRGCGWAGRSAAGAGWPLRSGETQPERQVLQQLYQEPSPAGADKLASLPTPVVQEGEASQMTIPTFRNPNLMKRWQAGEDAQTYDDSAAGALMMGRAAYRGCGWAGRSAAGAGWPLRSGETQPERQVLQQLYQEPSPAGADKLPSLPTPVVQEGEASQMSIPTSRNPNLMKRWQAGEDAQTYDDSAAGALMMGRAAYRGCGWAGRSAAGAGWPLRSGETQPERQILQQLYQEPSPAGADKLASLPTPVVQEGEASQMSIPTSRNPNLMKRWQAVEGVQSSAGALALAREAYRCRPWYLPAHQTLLSSCPNSPVQSKNTEPCEERDGGEDLALATAKSKASPVSPAPASASPTPASLGPASPTPAFPARTPASPAPASPAPASPGLVYLSCGQVSHDSLTNSTTLSTTDDSEEEGNLETAIQAKYYVIKTTSQWRVYEYCVDFNPEEENIEVRKKLLKLHSSKIGASLFDGTVLHTVKRLCPDPLMLYSIRETDGKRIQITITLTCDVSKPGNEQSAQIFSVIIRKCFQLEDMQRMGRDYFDPLSKITIPEYGLQMWTGYKLTINQYEDCLLMVLEQTPKVLRMDTVLQMLNLYATTKGSKYKQIFSEEIVGKIVWTDYNKKCYRIDEVSWQHTPMSTFESRNKMISYMDYYRKRYDIIIHHTAQPLLISCSHPRKVRLGMPELVYLVPELCRQTGLTDEMSSDSTLNRVLDEKIRTEKDSRLKKLLKLTQRMTNNSEVSKKLWKWVALSQDLINFKGRQLPAESIVLGCNERILVGDTPEGWTRAMRSKPLLQTARLTSWVVITPGRLRRKTEDFVHMMMKNARDVGFRMPEPDFCFLADDHATDYYDACEVAIVRKNSAFVMCVLARRVMNRYHAIKRKCTVERGVPSQVILSKNMTRDCVMTIATKVAIQINCKLGAVPWRVENSLPDTLVIGYAVARDYQTEDKSYGAVVASLDCCMTRYFSAVNAHISGNELCMNMGCNVVTALRRYQQLNGGDLPHRILIYRDSTSPVQFPYVHNYEVTEIKTRLVEIYGQLGGKMAFIVVSRRVDMHRFKDRCCNGDLPPGGIVIDDVFKQKERYDFYLVSQSGGDSTISPTSYSVIEDSTGLHPDEVQCLTYKLTHMYFNCSSKICVPAVCQYAHKLANLAANTLHSEPHFALSDTLHFL